MSAVQAELGKGDQLLEGVLLLLHQKCLLILLFERLIFLNFLVEHLGDLQNLLLEVFVFAGLGLIVLLHG